jgi:hypothetical protein
VKKTAIPANVSAEVATIMEVAAVLQEIPFVICRREEKTTYAPLILAAMENRTLSMMMPEETNPKTNSSGLAMAGIRMGAET